MGLAGGFWYRFVGLGLVSWALGWWVKAFLV